METHPALTLSKRVAHLQYNQTSLEKEVKEEFDEVIYKIEVVTRSFDIVTCIESQRVTHVYCRIVCKK
jgi:hypothetical protein